MTQLLTTKEAEMLSFLSNINDAFKLPDTAITFGYETEILLDFGSDAYFSNYWYGPKADATAFAEKLAQYFDKQYKRHPPKEDESDFQGMVMLWDNGDNALVGNINFNSDISIWNYGKAPDIDIPSSLVLILEDGNDNSVCMIEYEKLLPQHRQDLLKLIAPEFQQDYLDMLSQ